MHDQGTEPGNGLVVASGWGIRVHVDRGHLVVHDGVGRQRRTLRLSRAYGGLERLVVIGHTGFITLEALRWIRDVGASFSQIGLDGEVIASGSADRPLNPKLRRAQVLASESQSGIRATRELVMAKQRGQIEVLTRFAERLPEMSHLDQTVGIIATAIDEIERAQDFQQIRGRESVAGRWYWKSLAHVPIAFESPMSRRVPDHWRRGGARTSSGSGFKGPRKANTPLHAAMNYAYAILETEAKIVLQAYGFDPSIGIMHTDKRYRPSLAADLMEPARPTADAAVLGLLSDPLRRGDFFETREGVCRVGPSVARQLASSGHEFREVLMPHAARLSDTLLGRSGGGKRRPRKREPGTVGKGARLRTTPARG